MFSSRLNWDLRPNRLARLLETKRQQGAALLDLTQSNPTQAGIAYPEAAIREALAETGSLRYEPSPQGLAQAREAVAGYYAARGLNVEPEQVFLTASTSEAYSFLFKLLADPGDEILVPRPSYPLFGYLAEFESARAVQYPLVYQNGWSVDLEALAQAVSPRSRALVVVHPNNPTGSFLKKAELERLVALCSQHNLALISDEVFSDYAFAPDANRVPTLAEIDSVPTFCFSGLSKVAGLPQMKLSWIVLAGARKVQQEARERLELIADTYLSVATPVQHALPRLLEVGADIREQIAARVRENLTFLRQSLLQGPCRLLDVEGGWYAIVEVPRTRSEEDWCLQLLEQDNVLVQPGFFYDFDSEAFLVMSLLTPPEILREGVGQIVARTASG
ncbi:MAG: pyridoxal phosphate-dependent aminotransferase [Acidobacteria bacterium]|nr:pyridoxal phosphate-dependent aminotransferase [Acidobacteriota bacterium]